MSDHARIERTGPGPGTLGLKAWRLTAPSVLPGFSLTFGYTLVYLSLIVLFPLSVLVWRASGLGFGGLYAVATEPRVAGRPAHDLRRSRSRRRRSTWCSACIVAWVLTRYEFPGRRFLDAVVDLPFALPTAVAGISLASLYAPNGWFGAPLAALGDQGGVHAAWEFSSR